MMTFTATAWNNFTEKSTWPVWKVFTLWWKNAEALLDGPRSEPGRHGIGSKSLKVTLQIRRHKHKTEVLTRFYLGRDKVVLKPIRRPSRSERPARRCQRTMGEKTPYCSTGHGLGEQETPVPETLTEGVRGTPWKGRKTAPCLSIRWTLTSRFQRRGKGTT